MLFQTLDDKRECVGVYLNGNLIYDEIPEGLSRTWSYSSFLADREIDYAYLYAGGDDLESACPAHLRDDWSRISEKLKSFIRSFQLSKIDLTQNCFFDLVPQRFLLEFCDLKNKITDHVFKTREKPKNYAFFCSLTKVIDEINQRPLNLDFAALRHHLVEHRVRQWLKKMQAAEPHIRYNLFGTKTGRLTTKKNSFPILTMDKKFRSVLYPNNDWFVELDFNAAELRTLLALSGHPQPQEDIHEWNIKNIFDRSMTREEAKKEIFSWLYNPSVKHSAEKVYNRDQVKNKYWNGEEVTTEFDRTIPADDHHALNYIVQSTTSDLLLRRMIKIHEMLKDKKSFISWSMHDSLVIDFADEERGMLIDLVREFSSTELGQYKTNVSAGKNYGLMRELRI